jgi:hypothetical protein
MPPDRLDELLHGLRHVQVAAPTADARGLIDRRVRRHVHRRNVVLALVACAASLVSVVTVSTLESDSVREIGTRPTRPDPVPSAPPAVRDPAIRLDPSGPFTDRQPVTITVPKGYATDWFNEGSPRLCMILADARGEVCDPLWAVGYDQLSYAQPNDQARVELRRTVFTPTGWRDCEDRGVTCRFVVLAADGSYRASERLHFKGRRTDPPVGLTIRSAPAANGLAVRLRPHGLAPDPTWLALHEAQPGRDIQPFFVQTCAYLARRSECAFTALLTIDPDRPDAAVDGILRREFFSFDGWHDCAKTPCYIVISVAEFSTPPDSLTVGGGETAVAAVPVSMPRRTPATPRPVLTVREPGPYHAGQRITVRADHVPENVRASFALCHPRQDPSVANDCGYFDVFASVESGTDIPVMLPLNLDPDCALGKCYLALMPGQEGAGPLARLAIDFVTN